jgi:hypothetical protein
MAKFKTGPAETQALRIAVRINLHIDLIVV